MPTALYGTGLYGFDTYGESASDADHFETLGPVSDLVIGLHDVFTYNGLLLNYQEDLEYYRVDDLIGFEDADLRITDEENTQEDGSSPGPGFYGSRTMTITGAIIAGTYPQALRMKRDMMDAFLDLVERPLEIAPRAGSIFTHPTVEIYCRKADKVLIPSAIQPGWFADGYFEVPFTLSLKATDPAYRSVQVHEQTLVPEAVSFLGRSYDRSYDLSYAQSMDQFGNPTTVENSMVVVNAGNWYALPEVTFRGLQRDARLVNHANEHEIRLSHQVESTDEVEVDVVTGEIVDQDLVNRSDYWDTRSDWMRLAGTRDTPGGANELELLLSDLDAQASLTVRWRDTYL